MNNLKNLGWIFQDAQTVTYVAPLKGLVKNYIFIKAKLHVDCIIFLMTA